MESAKGQVKRNHAHDGVTSHNEYSTQPEQGRDTETPCSAALQPVNEWGRSSRPEQCLLLVHQESRKWWRKLSFWLMEVTTVNSYILYQFHPQVNLTHLQYRRQVIESLAVRFLSTVPPRPGPGRSMKRPLIESDRNALRLNKKSHYPGMLSQAKECTVCSDRSAKKRHRSLYYCKTCRNHPPLCITPCFEKYHTLQHYK